MAQNHLYKQQVIAYLTDWHGEHGCEITVALEQFNNQKICFQQLVLVANEVDDGWKNGFENSIYNE